MSSQAMSSIVNILFQMNGWAGLYMIYSMVLSILTYMPWLVNKGGLNMKVAYPVNFISKQK